MADQQDRPEHRILGRAQDQLDRMRPLDHRLDHEAVDLRAGRRGADLVGHAAHGVGDRLLRAEVELDAADVALVGDLARQDFHRDGKADARRRCRRLGGVEHDLGRHDGNAVGRQHPLGFRLGQDLALLGQCPVHDGADQVRVRARLGHRGRRALERALAAAILHHVHEAAHGAQRRVVGRDAGLVQDLAAVLRVRPADPAADQRRHLGAGRAGDGMRHLDGRRERRRHVHHQHRADAPIVGQRIDRRAVARAVGVAHDVDRIGVRPGTRHLLVELRDGSRQQGGELAALVHQEVGGDDADAAAVGQDGQPLVARRDAVAQGLGGVEQLAQASHAHQSGAREGGIVDRGRARHRAGVRGGGLGRRGVPARLQHDHRLQPRRAARRRHELAGLRDALDIHQHGARLVVARQHVEHVAEIDVAHVAHRDQVREADALGRPPVGQTGQHGARLRHRRRSVRACRPPGPKLAFSPTRGTA